MEWGFDELSPLGGSNFRPHISILFPKHFRGRSSLHDENNHSLLHDLLTQGHPRSGDEREVDYTDFTFRIVPDGDESLEVIEG